MLVIFNLKVGQKRICDYRSVWDGAISDNGERLPAVDHCHTGLRLGCCGSPKRVSVGGGGMGIVDID